MASSSFRGIVATLGFGVVGGLGRLSNMTVGPGPSYGSSESCGLLNILIISWDNPFGVGVGFGPVLGLEDVLGVVLGKKLSDVSTIGENLILLAALQASFSCSSSSEL